MRRAESGCCKSYSLVLMDMNMPVMDGIDAGKMILNYANMGKVPGEQRIVALTGDEFSQEEEDRLRKTAGFTAFYVKPISRAAFAGIIQKFCL